MTTDYPERPEGVPRAPDPPARATEVGKQDPVTPDEAPEPIAPEVESARLLANQARPVLGAEGFADERIDEPTPRGGAPRHRDPRGKGPQGPHPARQSTAIRAAELWPSGGRQS